MTPENVRRAAISLDDLETLRSVRESLAKSDWPLCIKGFLPPPVDDAAFRAAIRNAAHHELDAREKAAISTLRALGVEI